MFNWLRKIKTERRFNNTVYRVHYTETVYKIAELIIYRKCNFDELYDDFNEFIPEIKKSKLYKDVAFVTLRMLNENNKKEVKCDD